MAAGERSPTPPSTKHRASTRGLLIAHCQFHIPRINVHIYPINRTTRIPPVLAAATLIQRTPDTQHPLAAILFKTNQHQVDQQLLQDAYDIVVSVKPFAVFADRPEIECHVIILGDRHGTPDPAEYQILFSDLFMRNAKAGSA